MADTRLLRAFVSSASFLRPDPHRESSAAALETARFLIAADLRASAARGATLPDAAGVTPDVAAEAARFFDETPPEAVSQMIRAGARSVVYRGAAPSSLPLLPGLSPAVERPSKILGPFLGEFDQPILIGLITPVAHLVVRVAGDPRPVALFSSARVVEPILTGVPNRIELDAGTAWLRGRALAPAAPEAAYSGIRIASGTWALPAGSSRTGDTVVLPALSGGSLELKPEMPPAGGTPTGADSPVCAGVAITPPATITFTWTPNCFVGLGGGGGAKAFGGASGPTLVSFAAGAPAAPIWDQVSIRVILPDAADLAKFDAAIIPTSLATFARTAPIGASGWAMPVAFPQDPSALGEAAEVGAWWLRLDGPVTVTWKGGPHAPSGLFDSRVLLGNSSFSLVSLTAKPGDQGGRHDLLIWPSASGPRLSLSATLPDNFAAGVTCDSVRGEAFAATVSFAPVLDRPVSAVGTPLALVPTLGFIILTKKGSEQTIAVTGVSPPTPVGTPMMVALENAYVSVSGAWLSGLQGATPDFVHVESGTLAVQMAVADWLPTLPDPYVASVAQWKELPPTRPTDARLIARATWTSEGTPTLAFTGSLDLHGGSQHSPQKQPSDPQNPEDVPWIDTQTTAGQEPLDALGARRLEAAKQREERERNRFDLGTSIFADAVGPFQFSGALLLDVSTRKHQVGVQLLDRSFTGGNEPAGFVVNGMGVQLPFRLDSVSSPCHRCSGSPCGPAIPR